MATPRRLTAWLILVAGGVCVAIAGNFMFELIEIARAVRDFQQDEVVQRQKLDTLIARGEKPSADEVINPPFLKHYGLDMNGYTNDQGYFSPNGSDWGRWSLRTKAAAFAMFLGKGTPSSWALFWDIRCVNRYYARNGNLASVGNIATACEKGDERGSS